MARFEGRVAVVTGGASGIGRASVLRFLAEGARVVAADYNEATAKQLAADVDAAGGGDRLRVVRADVSVEDDVAAAIDLAVAEFGRLDVVFNNAGVGGAFGPVTDVLVEDWDYTFAVLCRGVFLGIKHGARVFKAQGEGGAIVNTASVAGLRAGAAPMAYSGAKAAVIAITRSAANELAPDRIRVNAICPGAINTPLLNHGSEQAVGTVLDGVQPWPMHGRPEDIAAAALYLASDDAGFVTGEHLVVDGGLTIVGSNGGRGFGTSLLPPGAAGVSHGSTGEAPVVRLAGEST